MISTSVKTKAETTGLGLALVKGLAHAMHGTVGVDSIISEGSTFYYECEAAPAPDEEPNFVFEVTPWILADVEAEENELDEFDFEIDDESDGQYEGFKVLVVDPVDAMRTLIARTLERLGCTIYPARTGAEALVSAQEIRPDLVITDWDIEELSASDLVQQINTTTNLSHCRVIVLTAKTDETNRAAARELGVYAYLGKRSTTRRSRTQSKKFWKCGGASSVLRRPHKITHENYSNGFYHRP